MQPGFNTSFRYKGVVLHVQTEDSGLSNPHVITHLFHEGKILVTKRREYGDWIGRENLAVDLKHMMQEQHKSMLRTLVAGECDSILEERQCLKVQHSRSQSGD